MLEISTVCYRTITCNTTAVDSTQVHNASCTCIVRVGWSTNPCSAKQARWWAAGHSRNHGSHWAFRGVSRSKEVEAVSRSISKVLVSLLGFVLIEPNCWFFVQEVLLYLLEIFLFKRVCVLWMILIEMSVEWNALLDVFDRNFLKTC